MNRIIILPNIKQPDIIATATKLSKHLQDMGKQVWVNPQEDVEADLVLVLGGDGTMLHYALRLQRLNLPVMAVNCGNLGFMSTVELSDFDQAWLAVETGDYSIEHRMTLDVTIERQGDQVFSSQALNELVVAKGPLSRMGRIEVMIDDFWLDTFPADGIIVATPTGSTAYSLSAGGPLVNPLLALMIITPIAAHALYARPVIVPPDSVISIDSHETDLIYMTIDGRENRCLECGDTVVAKRSHKVIKLIKLKTSNYYETMRHKLRRTEVQRSAY